MQILYNLIETTWLKFNQILSMSRYIFVNFLPLPILIISIPGLSCLWILLTAQILNPEINI